MEDDFADCLRRRLQAKGSADDALDALLADLARTSRQGPGSGLRITAADLLRAIAPLRGTDPQDLPSAIDRLVLQILSPPAGDGDGDDGGTEDRHIVQRHEGGPETVPRLVATSLRDASGTRYVVPHDGPPDTVPRASCLHRELAGIAHPTEDDIARALLACRDGRD